MKNCRYIITQRKLLGIIFCSMAIGMFLALMISWWGYVISFLLFALGLCFICSKK